MLPEAVNSYCHSKCVYLFTEQCSVTSQRTSVIIVVDCKSSEKKDICSVFCSVKYDVCKIACVCDWLWLYVKCNTWICASPLFSSRWRVKSLFSHKNSVSEPFHHQLQIYHCSLITCWVSFLLDICSSMSHVGTQGSSSYILPCSDVLFLWIFMHIKLKLLGMKRKMGRMWQESTETHLPWKKICIPQLSVWAGFSKAYFYV
jgi:hypothetical protein